MKAAYQITLDHTITAWNDLLPSSTYQQLNEPHDYYLNSKQTISNTPSLSRSMLVPFHVGLKNGDASNQTLAQATQEKSVKAEKRRRLEEMLTQLDAEFDADREAGLLSPDLLQKSLVQIRARIPYK